MFIILLGMISSGLGAYPIDGYALTGIRRLLYLQLVMKGRVEGQPARSRVHSVL